MSASLRAIALLAGLLGLGLGAPATAAPSLDSCDGVISSLPATISTPGVWCLDRDLSTAVSSGVAIDLQASYITLDCNGFKVGGLQAGPATNVTGIRVGGELGTVRNCSVRGFMTGIEIDAPSGTAEMNRLDSNTQTGILGDADWSVIRQNMVSNTGGRPGGAFAAGIASWGRAHSLVDNEIDGVHPGASGDAEAIAYGIWAGEAQVQGNRIAGLSPRGDAQAYGIDLYRGAVVGNVVAQATSVAGIGIKGDESYPETICRENVLRNFTLPTEGCVEHDNQTDAP